VLESIILWRLGAAWRGRGTLDVIVDGLFLVLFGEIRWWPITSKDCPQTVEQSTREGALKEAPEGGIGDIFVGVLGKFHGIKKTQMWHLLEDAN
jgi:hypothetical protein